MLKDIHIKLLVKTLINQSELNGLIVKSEGCLYKSFDVCEILKKSKQDFVVLSCNMTPLKFYEFLYKNRQKNKVIVLDNILNCSKSGIIRCMLRCATETTEGRRVVGYHTTTKLNFPKEFVSESKIILCVDKLPKDKGLISRCYVFGRGDEK